MKTRSRLIALAATAAAAGLAIAGAALATGHGPAASRASAGAGCAKPGICSPQSPQTKTGAPGPTAAQLTQCIEAHGLAVPSSTPLKVWLQTAVFDPNDASTLTACGLDAGPPISK
jgi:hypothetical protein